MATMIKEERYVVYVDTEEHALRVQELLCGLEPWPRKFLGVITGITEMDGNHGVWFFGKRSGRASDEISEFALGL